MRNANAQRANSMIPVRTPHQARAPHVSHAEIEAQDDDSETVIARSPCEEAIQPSLLRSYGEASRVSSDSSGLASPKR